MRKLSNDSSYARVWTRSFRKESNLRLKSQTSNTEILLRATLYVPLLNVFQYVLFQFKTWRFLRKTETNRSNTSHFSFSSIVVHGANRVAPRYVCGNITMLREVVLETGTGTWRGDNNDGSVSGSMRVSQKSDIDPSLVSVCCCEQWLWHFKWRRVEMLIFAPNERKRVKELNGNDQHCAVLHVRKCISCFNDDIILILWSVHMNCCFVKA